MNNKFVIDKSNRLQKLVNDFLKLIILEPNQTIVIGLSGGPDSVALLHILKSCKESFKYKLIAAHLDHEWREGSQQDSLFCKKLTKKLNIPFITAKASELNLKTKFNGSQEEIGRKLRQHFFTQIAQQYDAKFIALAHHLDDQIETFLIRLTRGSSLNGLGCMKAQNGPYIRPLLQINKLEILDYLEKNNLEYITDPSNESEQFLRNRIRKILPELKQADSRFEQNFARTLQQIQGTNEFIIRTAKQNLEMCTTENKLNLKKLFTLDPFLQKQIILQWLYKHNVSFIQTEKFVAEIFKFLRSPQGGTHQIHKTWCINKKQNLASITESHHP